MEEYRIWGGHDRCVQSMLAKYEGEVTIGGQIFVFASYNYLQLYVITLTTECIEFLRSMCTLAAQGYYN